MCKLCVADCCVLLVCQLDAKGLAALDGLDSDQPVSVPVSTSCLVYWDPKEIDQMDYLTFSRQGAVIASTLENPKQAMMMQQHIIVV